MNTKYMKMMAFAAIAAGALSACTEGMDDWSADASYDRLFAPTTFKIENVEGEATMATVTFSLLQGSEALELNLSTDSLYAGMDEMTASIFTETFTESPATVTGLIGDTKYFARYRSKAGDKVSKWVYVATGEGKGYALKTPKEQIMNAVDDDQRGEDFITVSWTAGMEVTHLMVHTAEVEEDKRIDLDATAIAIGQYTITGLAAATNYTITIWYNEAQRGSVTTSTFAAAPKGDYVYRADASLEKINNVLMAEIAELAKSAAGNNDSYSATIVIPAGLTIDIVDDSSSDATSLKIPEGMSVTFFGAAGEQPVVKMSKSINLAGSHAYIRFENLHLTDGGCQYIINQSDACAVEELSFKDCNFSDLERSIIRTQGSSEQTFGLISFENCVGTNLSNGNSYSMIQFGQSNSIAGQLVLSNSTFDTVQRSMIEASKGCISKIGMTNCTFYNIVADARYFIDANGQNTNIELTNIILGKTYHATLAKGVRTAGTISVTNSIRTSDCFFASNNFKAEVGFPAGEQSSADIFKDPENHDFTLKIFDKVGDPRWYKVED